MSGKSRIDELDSPLNTSTELERYLKKIQDLYKDLYMELGWGAEMLQRNLATLPVTGAKGGPLGAATSRIRARRVANNLKRAAEASKYAGGQAVKTWREFTKSFAPEIEASRQRSVRKQPNFKVDQ